MKLLKKLITKPQIFKRTIGLSLDQFKMYAQSLTPIWRQAEQKRKLRAIRYRKIGGGRQYNCKTIEEMLAIVFLYYKSYWTQEFIGALFDLDQSNVSRLLKKMLPLIEKAADSELAIYLQQAKIEFAQISPNQRINNWRDFLEKHPDLIEVSIDATEQQCYRSSDYQSQKLYYSGKQKCHSLKTQIAVSVSGRILSDFAFSPQLGILIGSLILWQIKLSTNSSSIAKPLALALTIILAHSYPKYPGRAPKPVYE